MPSFNIDPRAKTLQAIGPDTTSGKGMDGAIKRLKAEIIADNQKRGNENPYIVCVESRKKPGNYKFLDISPAYAGANNNIKLIINGKLRVCTAEEEIEAKKIQDSETQKARESKDAVKFEKGVSFLGQMVSHAKSHEKGFKK